MLGLIGISREEKRVTPEPSDVVLAYDVALDTARWRAAALEAIGDDWDPIEVLVEEHRRYAMLYSGLDDEQRRTYDELVRAGILPDRTTGPVPD
ncbi:MAG: DUF6400 family protein [Streptosporangiaceae bacterium]